MQGSPDLTHPSPPSPSPKPGMPWENGTEGGREASPECQSLHPAEHPELCHRLLPPSLVNPSAVTSARAHGVTAGRACRTAAPWHLPGGPPGTSCTIYPGNLFPAAVTVSRGLCPKGAVPPCQPRVGTGNGALCFDLVCLSSLKPCTEENLTR